MIAEVIRHPELLSHVRSTIDSYRINLKADTIDFAYTELCGDPFLQSIYAETLRLHVASVILRSPSHADLDLHGWQIPENAVMLMSSYNAQMDSKYWSTTDEQPARTVDQFWAERFLVYPKSSRKDPVASDVMNEPQSQAHKSPRLGEHISGMPEFSLKGRSSNWFPYGGGDRMCPGRHFAKQEMISSLAILLTLFEIELVNEASSIPKHDMYHYGLGSIWPKGKMPIRIRRRTD